MGCGKGAKEVTDGQDEGLKGREEKMESVSTFILVLAVLRNDLANKIGDKFNDFSSPMSRI